MIIVCIWITEDFCVSLPYLPGCCSQGSTEKEATTNIIEAFRAVSEVYEDIPWLDRSEIKEIPNGTKERYIIV